MRRLLFHPLTSAILLAIFVADTWFVARFCPYSTIGNWICFSAVGRALAPSHQYKFRGQLLTDLSSLRLASKTTIFVRDPDSPGVFRTMRPNDESWDQATRDLRDHPRDSLQISCRPVLVSRGLWAPTSRIERLNIDFQFGENFSDSERAAARRQFVEESGAADILSFQDFQTLTTTDIDRTRPIYLGYAHNTIAAIVFFAFLASLAWIPMAPSWIRAKIGEHRLAAGLCPKCRYNLHGLREPKCPECGAPTISGGVPS